MSNFWDFTFLFLDRFVFPAKKEEILYDYASFN